MPIRRLPLPRTSFLWGNTVADADGRPTMPLLFPWLIPLNARQGDDWPPPDPPAPIPLPGDLRVAQLIEPEGGPHPADRWQMQRYDHITGSWRALVGRDVGRAAYWRAEPTFATEAEAIGHLLAFVRRRARKP